MLACARGDPQAGGQFSGEQRGVEGEGLLVAPDDDVELARSALQEQVSHRAADKLDVSRSRPAEQRDRRAVCRSSSRSCEVPIRSGIGDAQAGCTASLMRRTPVGLASDRVLSVVKDRRAQRRVGAGVQRLCEMVELTRAT